MSELVYSLIKGDYWKHPIEDPDHPQCILYPCVFYTYGKVVARIGYIFVTQEEKDKFMKNVGYSKINGFQFAKYGLPVTKVEVGEKEEEKKNDDDEKKEKKVKKITVKISMEFPTVEMMCIVMGYCGFIAIPQENKLYWAHAPNNRKWEYYTHRYSGDDPWDTTQQIVKKKKEEGWTSLDSFDDACGKLLIFCK